jgi:translocator protein
MSFLEFAPDPQKTRALKLFLIAALGTGALASLIAKPVPVLIAPWLIAPLWTLSYVLMAVAAWLVWKRTGPDRLAMALYGLQLLLTLVWQARPFAPAGLAMALGAVVTMIQFGWRNRLAGLTFLPCMIWNLFVAASAYGIWHLN